MKFKAQVVERILAGTFSLKNYLLGSMEYSGIYVVDPKTGENLYGEPRTTNSHPYVILPARKTDDTLIFIRDQSKSGFYVWNPITQELVWEDVLVRSDVVQIGRGLVVFVVEPSWRQKAVKPDEPSKLQVWDIKELKLIRTVAEFPTETFFNLLAVPPGKILINTQDGKFVLLSLETGFQPGARTATGSTKCKVIRTYQVGKAPDYTENTDVIHSITLLDPKTVLIHVDDTFKVLDLSTGILTPSNHFRVRIVIPTEGRFLLVKECPNRVSISTLTTDLIVRNELLATGATVLPEGRIALLGDAELEHRPLKHNFLKVYKVEKGRMRKELVTSRDLDNIQTLYYLQFELRVLGCVLGRVLNLPSELQGEVMKFFVS